MLISIRPASPARYRIDDVCHELRHIDGRGPGSRGRSKTRELGGNLPQQLHLAQDGVDTPLEHLAHRLAAIGMDAAQVLGRQLNRGQRILDFVRHLTCHLGPRFEAVGPLELSSLRFQFRRHAVEGFHQPPQFIRRSNGDLGIEVAACDAAGRPGQSADWIGDALGHR